MKEKAAAKKAKEEEFLKNAADKKAKAGEMEKAAAKNATEEELEKAE